MNNIIEPWRRNATASWSGYLHQGRVGIFVALKKINEIINGVNANQQRELLNEWIVEYETAEDFDIKQGNRVDSRHQVKANSNKNRKSNYASVLNDGGFNVEQTGRDDRFLHTICEIIDWDGSLQPNLNQIELFEYPNGNKYCSLSFEDDLLNGFCTNEIEQINRDTNSQMIFEHLLFILDEKIRIEHANKVRRDFAPTITFQEILDIIVDNNHFVISENQRLRLEFSEAWVNYKIDLEDRGEDFLEKEEEIDIIIENMYSSQDAFNNFLRVVQPHHVRLSINVTGFRDVFFKALLKINEEYLEDRIGYIKNLKHYTLTTINDTAENAPTLARKIIENSMINNSKLFFEGNYIINSLIDENFPDAITKLKSYSDARNEIGENNWDNQVSDDKIFFNPTKTEFLSINRIEEENILNNNL